MRPFAPRRILAATDFSDISTGALRHAVLWAQRFRADLVVLHVYEFPWITDDYYSDAYNIGEMIETAREASVERLGAWITQHVPPDVAVTSEFSTGSPPEVIEEYRAAGSIDLAVLGTHGRGGISRLLMGSVAERTLRLARQPTLIIRHRAPQEALETEAPQIRHILCPVNYSDVARAAFEHAAAVARTFAARLTVVFSVEREYLTPESLESEEEKLQSWLPAESKVELQMQPVVRHGDAAEQILTLAREAAVDLVVVGAQHRRFVDTTVLGVTTVRVTRHAPCPVLVVPRSSDAQAP